MSVDATFPGDSELAALMRSKDWSATPLGPVESWPPKLRAAVGILLTSRFAMWMGWGDDLAFLYNDAYRTDTLGTKHPWALGLPTREVWKEIWADVEPRITSVMTEGRSTWDEGLMLMLERSGYPEETYHTFSYSPLHAEDGVVRGLLCVVVEETPRMISERRVALLGRLAAEVAGSITEKAVFEAVERSLAGGAHDLPFTLIYLFDAAGTTATRVSSTGFAKDDQPATIAIGPDAPWSLGTLNDRALDVPLTGTWPTGPWSTSPTTALVVPLARQGQTRPAGVLIAGINPHRPFDAAYREFVALFAGQVAGALANARAYAAERERAESLAELDRAKTAFFSNVSHEFRTPLTLMLGPLDGLLTDPALPSEIGAELSTIQRNALRLLKLVNTMLDFSKIEAGRAAAQFRRVDLGLLTADLASVFRAAVEKAGLRYTVDTSSARVPVLVDRDMWEKIVLNLISNAFKFTLEGEIAVTLVQRGDHVELAVQDSGAGIPAAELPRVFERFHRVAGTKGRTHEGTGIGLALVQELVRLHGGTVAVTSEPGRGTRFTVSIPLGDHHAITPAIEETPRSPRVPDAFVEEAQRWLPDAPAVSPTAGVSLARQQILVADDNADMRDYIRRLLAPRWDVETVANGKEALASIEQRRPDLVITDVMMPELDGFGLVASVRANPRLRDLPIVMLSARAGEEARIEGLQSGANDYLVKPFASRELLAHVETQLLRAAVRAVEHASARRLASIFQQVPVSIAILRGPTHIFEIANDSYQKLVAGRAVVGLTVAQALPEVVGQGFTDLLDRVYQHNEPFIGRSVQVQLVNEAGQKPTTFYLDFIYQPLTDEGGAVTGIAVIAHDVTTLATAHASAESANRAKDDFLAMLGHELRNPLAPITTALELMHLRPNVGADRERSVIERQVKHLTGLVDDLLDISRVTRGKIELRTQTLDLADIIARAIEVASPLLEEHRHTLSIEVSRGLYVRGDATRLAQVASNILNNAAKYTPRGGQIAIRASRTGSELAFAITDNGIGIEEAMLTHVFEPFIQGRQSLDRAKGGLGLGLSIVDSLVKLHGGSVRVESPGTGLGSTFTVVLPAADAPAAGRADSPRRVPSVGSGRLMIVDDNRDAAEMLTEVLQAAGYEVRVAHDGPSALEVARSFQPEVAVLDLGLPVMDGFELARLLLAQAGTSPPKLVALTGYGQASDRSQTEAAGFAGHLVKPVDGDQLRALIDELLA